MVPTHCSFQAKYSCLIRCTCMDYMMHTCATVHIKFKLLILLLFLLFRMKTAVDLYKNDLSEHGNLLPPEIRNGLVLCIKSNLTNTKPMETANRVTKLAPGQDVNINALCNSITCLLQTMKKHILKSVIFTFSS